MRQIVDQGDVQVGGAEAENTGERRAREPDCAAVSRGQSQECRKAEECHGDDERLRCIARRQIPERLSEADIARSENHEYRNDTVPTS